MHSLRSAQVQLRLNVQVTLQVAKSLNNLRC